MRTTFHGLETARRALFTQQSALQTTGHNIANANTPGYSRQRVNFSQTEPYPAPAMNRPMIPGQVGTGVEAGTIQRVRDRFLDVQFRGENTKLGYWSARSESLSKMEGILDEPSDNGLSKTLDRFWQKLQDLASNPDNNGARAVVRQNGIAVAETFNYLSNSLSSVQADIKSQVEVAVKDINSIARQINSLNKQIAGVEPHGYLSNDLYDKRDALVDELSQLVNVKVSRVDSGGQSLDMAEGRYTIKIEGKNGPITLVDGENLRADEISFSEDGASGDITLDELGNSVSGKLEGLLSAHNELYPQMIADLDQMAYDFATAFNTQHKEGYTLDGNQGGNLFGGLDNGVEGAASSLNVLVGEDELDQIAASGIEDSDSSDGSYDGKGDGENALALADVIMTDKVIHDGGTDTGVKDFYESMIGSMAVQAQEANRLTENTTSLRQSAQLRRESVSGVSLDEEMTNLVQYQHSYNAAARMVTVVDEMLNRIINQMGV